MTASIAIPKSCVTRMFEDAQNSGKKNAPASISDVETNLISKVEELVSNILPLPPAGEDKYEPVTVTIYDDLPPDPIEEPSLVSLVLAWFSTNWKTLGLFGLGLVSLFMLRGMLRSVEPPAAAAIPQEAVAEAESLEEEIEEDESHPVLTRYNARSGASLREELISIVREDPDAAANVLRTWIGDAA